MFKSSPFFCVRPRDKSSLATVVSHGHGLFPAQLPPSHLPRPRIHTPTHVFDSCVYVSRLCDYRAKPYLGTLSGLHNQRTGHDCKRPIRNHRAQSPGSQLDIWAGVADEDRETSLGSGRSTARIFAHPWVGI